MTQKNLILNYMKTFGSITPVQAMADLGCMRLAARIADLKRDGHRIVSGVHHGVNRFGDKVTYAEYSLEKETK